MNNAASARAGGTSLPVLAIERHADGAFVVTVLPITHSAPADPASAVEIPLPVKRHLGLDDDPSWIVVAASRRRRYAAGSLPHGAFDLRATFLGGHDGRRVSVGRGDGRHYRGVADPRPLNAVHAQPQPARSDGLSVGMGVMRDFVAIPHNVMLMP